MGSVGVLSRFPVLRILIPFALGIVLYRLLPALWLPCVLAALVVSVLVVMRVMNTSASRSRLLRQYRIVPLSMAVVAIGWLAAMVAEPPVLDESGVNGKSACARIESIKYNEKSMLMQVKLLQWQEGSEVHKFRATHILLSTRGCNYDLVAGDLVAFPLQLERVHNMGNPCEMDYARYLHDKGIIYRQHTDVRELDRVGQSPTVMTRVFNMRQSLQHKILNSSLSDPTQALVIAMLLGNDDFIEPLVRDDFSRAGVAHVLALSGLHVAVITLIIWFLLFPLDYLRGKKLRLVLTLVILVGYDLLTGMSPSVIRATVMITFVFMSMIFYRKSTPLNAVATAALAILVFSPSALYSVGFQLSFITVVALIVFYQYFKIKMPASKVLNYVYSILLTSAVAMASTIVLTAYYFNTMSFMSIGANVLIMPLIPVFMVLGAIVVAMLAMGGGAGVLGKVLDFLTSLINGAVGEISSLSLAKGDVYVSWPAVIAYYAILVLLALWLARRNLRMLLAAGVVLVMWLAGALIAQSRVPHRGMVVFNSFNSTPVLYFNGSDALLWVPDVESDYDIENFKRWNRAFLARHGIDSVMLVDSTGAQLPGAVIKPPHASIMGMGIVTAGKGRWKHYEAPSDSTAVKFDYAIITKGFHSSVARLKELVDCDSVILSGGIYSDDLHTLQQECATSHFPHYNIKTTGAFVKME